MVRMPQNILASIGIGKPGLRLTKKQLIQALEDGGYGTKKARRWIETYIDSGSIQLVAEDPIYGLPLYTCKWWKYLDMCSYDIRMGKVYVELTEEEAAIIESHRRASA